MDLGESCRNVLRPPRHSGLTRTDAFGDRSLCLPSRLLGVGGGGRGIMFHFLLELVQDSVKNSNELYDRVRSQLDSRWHKQ